MADFATKTAQGDGLRRVLFLHLSGADWQLAQPLVDAGKLPHLERLIGRGVIGNLMSRGPRVHAMTATSLATGVEAGRHGIFGNLRPESDSRFGLRPTGSMDLRAQPIWDIVANAGMKSAAIGWPCTHPAIVFDGLVVSDVYGRPAGNTFEEWPVDRDACSNATLVDEFSELRMHPAEVTADMILPFVPVAENIDQETDERLPLLMQAVAQAGSVQAAATWIGENHEWNLLAVHFDLIERLSASFLQYRRPQMPHVTDTDHGLYCDVVDGAYQFFDMLLGRFLDLIDENCHIVLGSDHGYFIDSLRSPPRKSAGGMGSTYRELGVIALAGPGIKRDELLFGASLYDVAPTILAMLDIPISQGFDGKVLTDAFCSPPDRVEENTVQSAGAPNYGARWSGSFDEDLGLRQISEQVRLGYYSAPPNKRELAREAAEIWWLGNRAQVCIENRQFDEALGHLKQILTLDPDRVGALLQCAQCYLYLGRKDRCQETLDELAATGHDGTAIKVLRAKLAIAEGDIELGSTHLDEAEASGDLRGAIGQKWLEQIGCSHVEAQQFDKAEKAFREALELDPNAILARNGLGAMLLVQGHPQDAADHFRSSLANNHDQPGVHCDLGHCLRSLGRLEEAAAAYRQSLKLNPNLTVPKRLLAKTENEIAREATRILQERDDSIDSWNS